jgi:putative flippase GtrA
VVLASLERVLFDRLRSGLHVVVRELLKFGVVGAVAYVVDVGIFNFLRVDGPLEHKPLTAKAISVSVAVVVAWLGNRYWTFRRRRRAAAHHELMLFVAMNAIGLAIALACLAVSHYALGFTSALADNIAANGVGLVLGTSFRFIAYRTWVFTALRDGQVHVGDVAAEPSGGAQEDGEDRRPVPQQL